MTAKEVAPVSPGRFWLLCSLLSVATALSFLDRQVLSVLAPDLTREFALSNTEYSRVVFSFVLTYTAMTALGGRLMDALGIRLGLALAVGAWSIASAAHALAVGFWSLALARCLLGIGEGPCFPGSTKAAMEIAPERMRTFAIGFANGGSAFGAVVAPPLTAWLAGLIGWRGTFAATGIIGLAWVVAWLAATKDLPRPVRSESDARPTGFGELLRRPVVRRLLYARFLFDPVFYFFMFWIPQYLAQERGMSLDQIGRTVWIPFLVLGISTILGGRVADVLANRGLPKQRVQLGLMLAAALLTPCSWFIATVDGFNTAILLMSLLLLAHGFWIINFLGYVSERVSQAEIATTVGLTGTCGGVAAMGANLLIGWWVDHHSFAAVFAVAGVVYPLSWLVLLTARIPLGAPIRPAAV